MQFYRIIYADSIASILEDSIGVKCFMYVLFATSMAVEN